MHHTFLHISLSFLHYCDVKMRSVFESFSPAHTKTIINGNTIASLTEHAYVKMRSVFESFSPAHTKTLINGNTIASLTEHA